MVIYKHCLAGKLRFALSTGSSRDATVLRGLDDCGLGEVATPATWKAFLQLCVLATVEHQAPARHARAPQVQGWWLAVPPLPHAHAPWL